MCPPAGKNISSGFVDSPGENQKPIFCNIYKVNDTIEQIKQSEDYEQLKDFIDEKFYDKTEPKASALEISATVCTLLIALF